MTIKLDDPEVVAAIEAASAASNAAIERKNKELLASIKALKTQVAAFDGLDADEVKRLKELAEESETAKARAAGEFEKLEKRMKDAHRAEIEKRDAQLQKQQEQIHKLVAADGLQRVMNDVHVADEYRDAVSALMLPRIKVDAEGDVLKALLDDQPLTDALKAWAGTDQGKHFIKAQGNSGGGSRPGNGKGGKGGGEKVLTVEQFEAIPLVERSIWMKNGYSVAKDA